MKYLFLCLMSFSMVGFAQDETLSIVSYNLLNFPNGRNDCSNNTVVPNRQDTLKKITDYLQPDIFVACEVQNQQGVDDVLADALNGNGNTNYAAANFYPGYLSNILFYNSDKLVLKSQDVIQTSPRNIDHYVLYLKDPNLNVYYDTTFVEMYMMHLKAGNGSTDESKRAVQTQALMDYIANRPTDRNVFVCGDMNVYSSYDDGYQNMTSGSFALKDPIQTPGSWNNNGSYSNLHTQSTRTGANYDCGSKGGLDDRFDNILVSQNVINNTDNIQYQTGSYRAVGNDGNHFNSNLISGSNSMYPQNVVRALYYMSDHLPVELKVDITYPTSNGLALVPSSTKVSCHDGNDGTATITPNLGQAPYSYQWDANAGNQTTQTATNLAAGNYCVTVTDDLGETDQYCIVLSAPVEISYNSFTSDDPNGDCSGNIQLLVDGGEEPYSFSWEDFPTNSTESAYDLCAGTYKVTITDANGCELVLTESVDGTSGLQAETTANQLIRLRPNPAKEKLIVHSEKEIEAIQFLSITGRKITVQSNKVNDKEYNLNLAHLDAGTYIVMIKTNENWTNLRVVVE